MTRSQGIAAIAGAAALLGIAIRFSHRDSPAMGQSQEVPTEHRAVVATNTVPTGAYVGKDNVVYVNYGTRDPALQSFMLALMNGSYDATAKGRAIYQKICGACHQPNGMGKDGVAPPLAGSEWVLAEGGGRLVRIVLNGMSGPVHVKDRDWNLVMPPWRETLKDDEIAVVLSYVRSKIGENKAGSIKPESVSSARRESHPAPETAAELLSKPAE